MDQKKTCLNCKAIIYGRSDKKFCDDHCRSNYNYAQIDIGEISFVRKVNTALRKNRSILKELNTDGNTRILKGILIAKGFDFSYHTNIHETDKLKKYCFCYEMGYLILSDAEVLLVKKDI